MLMMKPNSTNPTLSAAVAGAPTAATTRAAGCTNEMHGLVFLVLKLLSPTPTTNQEAGKTCLRLPGVKCKFSSGYGGPLCPSQVNFKWGVCVWGGRGTTRQHYKDSHWLITLCRCCWVVVGLSPPSSPVMSAGQVARNICNNAGKLQSGNIRCGSNHVGPSLRNLLNIKPYSIHCECFVSFAMGLLTSLLKKGCCFLVLSTQGFCHEQQTDNDRIHRTKFTSILKRKTINTKIHRERCLLS